MKFIHPIEAIFFDLDGTLLDTAPDLTAAFNATLEAYHRPPVSPGDFRRWISGGATAMIGEFFKINAEHPDFQAVRSLFLTHYRENLIENTRVFPGIEELLNHLEQKKIPWGVVTNRLTALTEPVLAHFGLHTRCCCAISGDTLPHSKPHPAPLLHACQLANSRPERSIYVGDALTDIQAAHAAGLFSVAVSYGYESQISRFIESRAGAIIQHPLELLDFFILPEYGASRS